MSLTQALNTAVSGLRVTQSSMAVVASNVANAETPGYVRKRPVQITTAAGDLGVGVRLQGVDRALDFYLQRQLRTEGSGYSYASTRSTFYQRLQQLYGQPGSESALETIYNNFTGALQALATSPDSNSARYAVLSTGQVLAQHLNGMTADLQELRTDAELGLGESVQQANQAMQQIARINRQLGTSTSNDATKAVLLDERDKYLDQLASLMDIRVVETNNDQVNVFTNSGTQLVGIQASALAFDAKGTMTPAAQWSSDPALRAVGTITLLTPNGESVDLVANGTFRSGRIAALLEMRDGVLVEAQAQLDQIAAAMARALSDKTVAGTEVTSGAQEGFDLDIASVLAGNGIDLTYTDGGGATRTVTIVRVDDPAALPLAATATANPNDTVVGVDFSGGMASIVSQLNTALGTAGLQFSNSGGLLRVLDDGAVGQIDITSFAATVTESSLAGGGPELPFFLDGTDLYTGEISSLGTQALGLAGRIAVNRSLIADPTRLVVYQTTPPTPAGDVTRPSFLYDRLTRGTLDYAPQAGIGTAISPFSGSLPSYMRQVVSQQGEAASAAESLALGQEIVFNSLNERFSTDSAVNIDEEMANLLNLQNQYGANARVMTTIKEMLDLLMQM